MKLVAFVRIRKAAVATLGLAAVVVAAHAQNQTPIGDCDCESLPSPPCLDVTRCGFYGPYVAPCTGGCVQVIGGVPCTKPGWTFASVTFGVGTGMGFVGASQPLTTGHCGCVSTQPDPVPVPVPVFLGGTPCPTAKPACWDECY